MGFKYTVNTFISTFISSYFAVSALTLLFNYKSETPFTSVAFLQENRGGFDLVLHVLFIAFIMGILTLVQYMSLSEKSTAYVMLCSAFMFSVLVLGKVEENQFYVFLAVMLVMAAVILYSTNKGCFDFFQKDIKKGTLIAGVAAFAVVFGAVIVCIGVFRYITYSTPNFDFGIFAHMFRNMKETGTPAVTCERDKLMSHFAVHFSPTCYLILPFYYLFDSPITLQVVQAIVLYSGIIPLVLICKRKGLSNKVTLIVGAVFAAYPALGAGTFYDFHENCFLVPCLLWLFYFYETRKYIPMAVFTLLVLGVKEDAFIYILFFAAYIFISDKNWKISLPLIGVSFIWFAFASSYISANNADGVMTNRFENLIYNADDGLIGAVKTIILNPGYTLTQLFSSSGGGSDKVIYLLQLFIPLGFLPFATKKFSRYILLAPILINTLTMYQYQPNIQFQYTFGIIAFLFYLTVLNLSEISVFAKKYLLQVAAVAAVLLFVGVCVPKCAKYVEWNKDYSDMYEKYDYALEQVLPKDASVAASSFLVSHICDRDIVYEVYYHKTNDGKYKTDIDYVVLDMRYEDQSNHAAQFYLNNGYEEYYNDEGYVLILKKQ